MKIVNHTGFNLKIYIGEEEPMNVEGVLHLKANQEYNIEDGTKLLYVIDIDEDVHINVEPNVQPITS